MHIDGRCCCCWLPFCVYIFFNIKSFFLLLNFVVVEYHLSCSILLSRALATHHLFLPSACFYLLYIYVWLRLDWTFSCLCTSSVPSSFTVTEVLLQFINTKHFFFFVSSFICLLCFVHFNSFLFLWLVICFSTSSKI